MNRNVTDAAAFQLSSANVEINIESADGSNFPIAYRLRTVNALAIDSVLGFSVYPGYSYKIFEYDKDMGFEKCPDTWVKAFDRATIGNDTKYIRALVQKDDSTSSFHLPQ